MSTTRTDREAAADALRPHWRKNATNEHGVWIVAYVESGDADALGLADAVVDVVARLIAKTREDAVSMQFDVRGRLLCTCEKCRTEFAIAPDAANDAKLSEDVSAELRLLRAVRDAAEAMRQRFGDDYPGRFAALDEALSLAAPEVPRG